MKNFLSIKNKKYEIIKEKISGPYRKIYTLKDSENILYRFLIEDYREASFMYDKFHKAVINPHNDGRLKTVKIEDIKFE